MTFIIFLPSGKNLSYIKQGSKPTVFKEIELNSSKLKNHIALIQKSDCLIFESLIFFI